jgi:hypothetical protein
MNYPKYLSHKEVSAAKISAVDLGADGSVTVHLEGGFDNVIVTHHDRKHKPEPVVGGYLVQYSDGYISFSPAAAFEEGYALVDNERISGSPMHLVAAQKAREAAAAAGGAGDNRLDGKSQPGPIGDEDGAGDGSGGVNALSGQTIIQKDEDDDEDEDEEVRDVANNHGQPVGVGG